jgi:phage terminase small subunit
MGRPTSGNRNAKPPPASSRKKDNKRRRKELSPQQRLFANEYLVDHNAQEAAIRAGYSKRSAAQLGSQLLKMPKIKALIAKEQEKRGRRTEATADRVLAELACLGFSDIRRLFTDKGALKPVTELDDITAASISSIEVVAKPGGVDADGNTEIEHVHKIKLWDKNSALANMAKHFNMFLEHEQAGAPNIADREVNIIIISGKGDGGPKARRIIRGEAKRLADGSGG